MLLILDEYWKAHPELHSIPVYCKFLLRNFLNIKYFSDASALAKKCLAVYQTFVNGMNDHVQRQLLYSNPFVFKHVNSLKNTDHFDETGPCVVLATPGMLQSGLSRQLFEQWAADSKNGCIVAGYCVEGTLAKHILSEPEEITTLSGRRIPMRMQVSYISFSAHTDFPQTSNFITRLKPHHIILVHGEQGEMARLKGGLQRLFEHNPDFSNLEIHMPRNTECLTLRFVSEKVARLVGSIVANLHTDDHIQGILMRRNFNYNVLLPQDLQEYSSLRTSTVSNFQTIYYSHSENWLTFNLRTLDPHLEIEKLKNYEFPDYLTVDAKRRKTEMKTSNVILYKMFEVCLDFLYEKS